MSKQIPSVQIELSDKFSSIPTGYNGFPKFINYTLGEPYTGLKPEKQEEYEKLFCAEKGEFETKMREIRSSLKGLQDFYSLWCVPCVCQLLRQFAASGARLNDELGLDLLCVNGVERNGKEMFLGYIVMLRDELDEKGYRKNQPRLAEIRRFEIEALMRQMIGAHDMHLD